MADNWKKLDRYLRELTKWAERVTEDIEKLERGGGGAAGGGEMSRGPGRPPEPPDLGDE